MRLGVYTDYHYWRDGDAYYAERAFFTFITNLRPLVDRLVLLGDAIELRDAPFVPLVPMARTLRRPLMVSIATTDGSSMTMPWPRT